MDWKDALRWEVGGVGIYILSNIQSGSDMNIDKAEAKTTQVHIQLAIKLRKCSKIS